MNYGILLLLLALMLIDCDVNRTQKSESHLSPPAAVQLPVVHADLFARYGQYREGAITHRRFKHHDIVPLVERLKEDSLFTVSVAGKSMQQRDIYLVTAGSGPVKIMLWSQMHGDEPTATMAMLDIFNFLRQSDELDPVRKDILAKTTLYFVPMLNPDGAEQYERRNALGIDLNRDALQLASPESRILKNLRDSIQPHFGFNLHDQNTRYTAGNSSKPATISFLAPAYNYDKSVNEVRGNAMKLIVALNRTLQQYIPGQVAKYADDHEPRAFGDNIQKWGTSVVLIESGGYPGDVEKQHIRKLNFVTLLDAFHTIGYQGYTGENIKAYYQIPQNGRFLFDLVLRNVTVAEGDRTYRTDIGINRYEENCKDATAYYYRSQIEELGDLSTYYGYEELDAEGTIYQPGKTYPVMVKDMKEMRKLNALLLLNEGYLAVKFRGVATKLQSIQFPLNIVKGVQQWAAKPVLSQTPNFLLVDKDGQVNFAVVNGFVREVARVKGNLDNALVLR